MPTAECVLIYFSQLLIVFFFFFLLGIFVAFVASRFRASNAARGRRHATRERHRDRDGRVETFHGT